jgi:curli biogenesis system outer membrane secretion channel CsgG
MNRNDKLLQAALCVALSLGVVVERGFAQAQAGGEAPAAAGAPDSGFVDLATRGSGKLKQAIAEYLEECGLVKGENPNGLWVQTGTAEVAAKGGSAQFGESRRMAFMEARLRAQADLVKSVAIKNAVMALRELQDDSSVLTPQFMEPEGFDKRIESKVNQLTEATLDAALKDLGQAPEPTAKLESKRDTYRKTLMKVSYSEAYANVSGFSVLQTFEAVNESDTGRVSVGVVIGRRPNSLGWIREIARGGGATGIPRDKPGKSLQQRIPRDPSILFERFGTRLVSDENGQVCIIAYGQSSPNITKGTPEDVIDQMIETHESYAEQDAFNALTEFLDSTVAWQKRQEDGQVQRRSQVKSVIDGVEVTSEENPLDTIKKLNEKTVSWSKSFVRGATPYYTWQGNHPDFGNPIVGCVIVWTPAAAAAAGRFNNPGAGGGEGFKAKGGTPGVRRSREDDVPTGRGGGAEEPVPVDAGANSGCEGTEASGEGPDVESATLAALKNAVRQSCGVAVEANSRVEKASASAIADIRVNEACQEMSSAFLATTLASQDISVRTRGLVRSYRILDQFGGMDAGTTHVSICAEIVNFDPKNPRPGARPTLVILKPEARTSSFAVMGSAVPSAEFTGILESGLSGAILKTRAFSILERSRLGAVLGEQAMAASGLADIMEQAKLGRLLTADCILVTEIEDIHAVEEEKIIKLTGTRLVKRSGAAKINWKLVSVGTGELLDQDSVSVALDDEGFKALARQFPGAPVASAVMNACVEKLVPDLVTSAAPLRVAQVVGSQVFLNRGRELLTPGQMFTVYRQAGELTDPTTGRSLGRAESKVGVIKIDRCESEFSLAVVVSGELSTEDAGSVCRPGV